MIQWYAATRLSGRFFRRLFAAVSTTDGTRHKISTPTATAGARAGAIQRAIVAAPAQAAIERTGYNGERCRGSAVYPVISAPTTIKDTTGTESSSPASWVTRVFSNRMRPR